MAAGLNPIEVQRGIDEGVKTMVQALEAMAVPLSGADMVVEAGSHNLCAMTITKTSAEHQ